MRIIAHSNTIRNALAEVRRFLGLRLRDTREVSREGRVTHWDVTLQDGTVVEVHTWGCERGRRSTVEVLEMSPLLPNDVVVGVSMWVGP